MVLNQTTQSRIISFMYGDCETHCESFSLSEHADFFVAIYDFTETGAVRWFKPNGVSHFVNLECGHIYFIVIKSGNDVLNIPNGVSSFYDIQDSGFLGVANCSIG